MAVIDKITYNVPDTMATNYVCTVWGRRMPTTNSLPVSLCGIYLTNSSNAQAEILSQTSQIASQNSQIASLNNQIITKNSQIAELSKAKQHWS